MDRYHQSLTLFCEMDDFCQELREAENAHLIEGPSTKKRGPERALSTSEIMTILVMFHEVRYRDFKTFYAYVVKYWSSYFTHLPSYSCFINRMKEVMLPLTLFVQLRSGKRTGIYYIDSSCLPVCHLKRSKYHRTFDQIAQYGKTSVGWFFGLKLHLVINDKGQLIAFKITQGNRHDGKEGESLLSNLEGLAFGDKGYIGKEVMKRLLDQGLKLITRQRKNMKKVSISRYEKQLLNQRGLVETVFNHLKFYYQIWHTRHRSLMNALTHLVAGLAAYTVEPLSVSAIKLLGQIS